MNLQAKRDIGNKFEEIVFPNDSLKYMTKSNVANVQMVEFSPQGNLIALGTRSSTVLIVDFLTMGIVRVFTLQEDFGLQSN